MLPASLPEDILYRLALTFIEGIGAKHARGLIEHFGNAEDIFKASAKQLKSVAGLGEIRAKAVKDPDIFARAQEELDFIVKKEIRPIFITDEDYPAKLKLCADAPAMLFYQGNASLNAARNIAIVGTRKNTEYGQRLVDDLVDELAGKKDLVVYSGLAYGIDTIAHKRAVKTGIPTIGVMGHGLDKIYPQANVGLAKEMRLNGGILTEFASGTSTERTNFPMRNRIVAGICDVTIVVESDITGGALITARIAASYNREVAAFPGRVHDTRSSGCNMLIRNNEASLITNANDLLSLMNWDTRKENKVIQRTLLLNLLPEEQKVIDLLQQKDQVHTDEIMTTTGQQNSSLAATLLSLEMQGLIKSLPGKYYRVN